MSTMASVPKGEWLSVRQSGKGTGPAIGSLAEAAVESRALVARAQGGDKEAFEELVRRHQHRVFAVAGGILKQREDVEDVAQQIFVKAYFALARFDQRAAFSTWLYTITVNECWDFLRKKKVRPLSYESELNEEQTRQYGAAVDGAETRPDALQKLVKKQEVEALLDGLEERDRLMLILKEVEGFSVMEIGEILELNTNTVKVRLFRARAKIVAAHQKRSKKRQMGK